MKKINVNSGRDAAQFSIPKVEEKYNAKFVGQLPLKDKFGNWQGDECADVYWQESPPVKGYSNYFALFMQGGTIYITTGAQAVDGIITGIRADDGEVIYSRYRHDYRQSWDLSVFIDGGRDYTRCDKPGRLVNLVIVDGEFYELEGSETAPVGGLGYSGNNAISDDGSPGT